MLGGMVKRSTGPVSHVGWTRSVDNPILSPTETWEETAVGEPSVLYEGGTWKMWYTGGWDDAALGYATCSGDPTDPGNWTKYVSNPVLGQGTVTAGFVSGTTVRKIGSTYYAFYYDTAGGGNLKVSTSSDGITWNTPTTAIASNAVAWMSGWANCFFWNEGGTDWKMLVEGRSTSSGFPWRIAYATSADGLAWTVVGITALPTLQLDSTANGGGPWLARDGLPINGRYQLWFHTGRGNYTDIRRASSADAQLWTIHEQELAGNGSTYEKQQVADASVVELGDVAYLFYSGVNNDTSTSYVNVATYAGSLANRVRWS